MAKRPAEQITRQVGARLDSEVFDRLEALRAVMKMTQAEVIAAGVNALEKQLTAEQRRAFQFFLKQK